METLTYNDYEFIFDKNLKLVAAQRNGVHSKDTEIVCERYHDLYNMLQSLKKNNGILSMFSTNETIDEFKRELNLYT